VDDARIRRARGWAVLRALVLIRIGQIWELVDINLGEWGRYCDMATDREPGVADMHNN
jgi:hypothetical protein